MRTEYGTLRDARPVITWEGITEIKSCPDADLMALAPPRTVEPAEVRHLLSTTLHAPLFTGRALFPFVSTALAVFEQSIAKHGLREIQVPADARAQNLVLLHSHGDDDSLALPLLDRTHLISIRRDSLMIAEVVRPKLLRRNGR